MNTDIRLSTEFFRHPKTLKLKRRLGLEGIISLQQLWIWVAQNRPTGSLAGMDIEDIALAAGWDGEEQTFVQTLITLRWLDEGEDGALSLHNWTARQEYAARSEERVDKARKAAASRWDKKDAATGQTPQNPGDMPADARSNARSMPPDATSNASRMLTDARSINEHATSNAKSMPRTEPNLTEPIPEIQNTPLTPLEPDAAVAADTDTRDSVPAWVEQPVPGWTEQPVPDDTGQPPLPEHCPEHAVLDDCPFCRDAAVSEAKAGMPSPAPPGGQIRAESSGTVDSLSQAGEALLGASTGQKSGMPQKAAGKRPRYRPKDYDAWIARYPRHRRTGAATQWDAACRDKRLPSLDVLMQALDWQINSEDWTKDGGQYVLGAGRYLKEGHWADEPPPQRQSLGGRMSAPIEDRSKWDSQHTKLGTWTPQDVANLFAGTR